MNQSQAAPPAPRRAASPPTAPGTFSQKLVGGLAERFGIQPEAFLQVLRDSVFKPRKEKGDDGKWYEPQPFTDAELATALVLCELHDLNPFAREIFVARHKGALLVVVSVDGWLKVLRRAKGYQGIKTILTMDDDGKPFSCTCTIHMEGLKEPIEVTEYMIECRRSTDTWDQWPARMLRHKATIQGIRVAVGLAGAIDEDDLDRLRDVEARTVSSGPLSGLPVPAGKAVPLAKLVEDEALEEERVPANGSTEPSASATSVFDPPAREPGDEPDAPSAANGWSAEELFAKWNEVRRSLSSVQIQKIRAALGVEAITAKLPAAALERALQLAQGQPAAK